MAEQKYLGDGVIPPNFGHAGPLRRGLGLLPRLIAALELLKDKQANLPPKKHGNMPV